MDLDSIRGAYRRYASYYDKVFGPFFAQGLQRAVERLNEKPGQRILEVGVGTGLSLPKYDPRSRVVGIDVSPDMLAKAEERVARECQPGTVESLQVMDAEAMDFPDNSFDSIACMYVVSVVPDPQRLINEIQRVCKPGGDIYIVNHFASRNPVVRGLEKSLRPLSKLMGFRPDMEIETLPNHEGFPRLSVDNANMMGYWKLIHYRNGDAAAGEEPTQTASAG